MYAVKLPFQAAQAYSPGDSDSNNTNKQNRTMWKWATHSTLDPDDRVKRVETDLMKIDANRPTCWNCFPLCQ